MGELSLESIYGWRCQGALRALRLLFVRQELQMGHPEWLVAQWHEAGHDLLTL